MFSNVTIDPQAMRPILASLRLTEQPEPVLLYAHDGGNTARIRPANIEWAEHGVAACLMALSYQWTTLEPKTDAIGVWLPRHHAVLMADATMHCHVISLGDTTAMVPERERVQIAIELRALIGTALMRPGRMTYHDPIVIASSPVFSDSLVRAAAARGLQVRAVMPQEAPPLWDRAGKVFIHVSALPEMVAAGLPARADITILAPVRTAQVFRFAQALRTDDLQQWPAATHRLADSLANHVNAQNLMRADMQSARVPTLPVRH